MPRISILLPCRDAAAHLADAIASLDRQTWHDYEVLAIDDGSTDTTGALLDAWAGRDGRVRVVHTPHGGLVAALQHAATLATGELIARMDADDVAHPDRLAEQVALLDHHADIAACGTLVRYFPRHVVRGGARRYEAWINGLVSPEQIARDVFVECPLPHPTLMIRRSAFDAVGGYIERGWPEDHDLVLRLWRAGRRMAKVPRVLLDWRESDARLSRRDARYGEASFRECKAHHLLDSLARDRDGLVVWGAGPVGKAFARTLTSLGGRLAAFVDLDPRKIGQTIHGAPVIAPDAIHAHSGAFAVAAVAGAAARREIRAALDDYGWVENVDYAVVA